MIKYLPHIFALLFILAFAAFAWTEPGVAPPGGNVPAPLNVSNVAQEKTGGLILNTWGAPNGLIVDKGNVGIGETNPSEKLDVAGNIDLNSNAIKNVGSVNFNDGTSQSTAADTLGVFGDGSDGDIVISSSAELTRDMYYNNLTVNPGVELKTKGFRIHIKNTATINGIISNNGGNADWSFGGITMPGSLGGGGTGGQCASIGGWFIAGSGESIYGGFGGNGGVASAAGGIVFPPTANAGGFRALPSIYFLRDFEANQKIRGGAGGGSGYASPYYCGGGGGGGGGVIFLSSRNLILNGTIRANGGDGSFASYPPGTGRGGGGGGGLAVVIYNLKSGSGSIQVQGGVGLQNGFPGTIMEIDLP